MKRVMLVQEVKTAKKQRDELVKQQKDDKSELEEKIRRRQQKLDKLGQQLQDLKARVAEKQTQLEKQDKVTCQLCLIDTVVKSH